MSINNNSAIASGSSKRAYGSAIYQGGSFIVSGSINLYNSSNVAKENDVYLPDDEKRVVLNGKLTNSNTTVMKLTPNSYAFGAYVVEKGGSINESNFKSSLEKNRAYTKWYIQWSCIFVK